MDIAIHANGYEAVIDSFGGGIRSLTFHGDKLLETYTGRPPMGANTVLAPWPNRLEDGQFSYQGISYQLPINEPERNNALHGVVDREWELIDRGEDYATIGLQLPAPWPFPATLRAEYRVDADGLHARYVAEHEGPFAWGLHTYVSALGAPVDECILELPVATHHALSSDRLLPTGASEAVKSTTWIVSDVELDDCFSGSGGCCRFYQKSDPTKGVQMHFDVPWVQVFTAPSFPGLPEGQRALAVEPMSAPPNALRSGIDLSEPGESVYSVSIGVLK